MATGRVNVSGGGLKILPKPIEKTFMAFENILKNDGLELSTGSSTTNGRVRKAVNNTEQMRDPSLTTVAQSGEIHADKLDATKAIVFYRASTGQYPTAHVATLNPLTGDYTKGTEVTIESVACVNTAIIALSATKAVAIYEASSVVRARVLNISGTTITLGANIYTVGTSVDQSKGFKISDTQFALFYRSASNSGYAVIGTVTGDVIAFGTLQNWNTLNTFRVKMLLISPTKAVIFYGTYEATGTIYSFKARVITISGTVITFKTEITIYSQASNIPNTIGEWLVVDSLLLALYNDGSSMYGRRITLSGETLTMGTAFNFAVSDGPLDSSPCNENCIVLARASSGSGNIAVNSFSDSYMRIGKGIASESAAIGKKLLPFEGVTFLQLYIPNGGSVMPRYFKSIKYVGAIAKADATAGSNVQCLTL